MVNDFLTVYRLQYQGLKYINAKYRICSFVKNFQISLLIADNFILKI